MARSSSPTFRGPVDPRTARAIKPGPARRRRAAVATEPLHEDSVERVLVISALGPATVYGIAMLVAQAFAHVR